MLDAVHADGRHRRALERAQEDASQGVAQGDAESRRQRRSDYSRELICRLFDFDLRFIGRLRHRRDYSHTGSPVQLLF